MRLINKIFYFGIAFLLTLLILDRFILKAYIVNTAITDFTKKYGRCRVKNKTFVYFNEGFGVGKFNEGRYIGTFYPKEKPKGVTRIAALGDSYVEGFQVFHRNHFLTMLEKDLNQNLPNDSIQVLNFGRSGFDFGDMYAYYERMVKQYNCNFVLFFLSNSDLNIRQTDPLIPKVSNENGELEVTNDEMPEKYRTVFIDQLPFGNNSSIYNMANNSRKLAKAGKLWPKLLDKFYVVDKKSRQKSREGRKDVSKLSYLILQKLQKENSQIIFINRDQRKLNRDFLSAITPPLIYFDLSNDSDLYKMGNDPHYWPTTGKMGHWNNEGHRRVEKFLFQKIFEMLY